MRDRIAPAANGALLDKTHMIKDEKRCAPARRFSQIFGYVFDVADNCQSRAVLLTRIAATGTNLRHEASVFAAIAILQRNIHLSKLDSVHNTGRYQGGKSNLINMEWRPEP